MTTVRILVCTLVSSMSLSAYIHIPFCKSLCPYCDFFSTIELNAMPRFVDSLCREISLAAEEHYVAGEKLDTIFFGGGTPSLLGDGRLRNILTKLRDTFAISADCEVTLEANPDDITVSLAAMWAALGVNRLSIGVQSFHDRELKILGRRHNSNANVSGYRMVRDAGIDNISVDLIYGLPNQTLDSWRESLNRAVELAPDHVSAYCLTLEGGTLMEAAVEYGSLELPDDDTLFDMYSVCAEILSGAGYDHYEVSNYARNGLRCRHNMAYWTFRPYLGFGPAAASYVGERRWKNVADLAGYNYSLECDTLPRSNIEDICSSVREREEIMLSLRLREGLDLGRFKRRFGWDFVEKHRNRLDEFWDAGLLLYTEDCVSLTERGMFMSDYVIGRLC